MHATGHTDRSGGGGGGGSWRLPPDETLQVADPKAAKEEELYGGEGHNWKSIIFSLLVIGCVIAGIVTAIYLLGYVDELLYWSGNRMRLDEFLRGDLAGERLPSAWVSPRHLVYQADDGGLAALDTANNTVSILVTNHTLRQLNVRGYECSPDLRFVLFQHNVREVYPRTFTAHYTVYDVTNDHHMPVLGADDAAGGWQHAAWLGAGGALLLVANNDLFARPGPPASRTPLWRLTDTGRPGTIYNGVPDWLYQEEVTKGASGVWGSADGSLVMYAELDDSGVGLFSFPWLAAGAGGAVRGGVLLAADVNSSVPAAFPEHRSVRYPTPGTPNPKVKLWIVVVENSTSPKRWEVKPPSILDGQEYYLTSAQWLGEDNSRVAAVWMNRAQNMTVVSTCTSADNWTCPETHTEKAGELPWLEVQPPPVYSADGAAFLLLAGVREGGGQHYTHIKHVSVQRQRLAVLSHGKVEVTDILCWDHENHLVYYLGTEKNGDLVANITTDDLKENETRFAERPGQRHVYAVRDPSYGGASNSVRAREREEPRCLTCEPAVWAVRLHYANCTYWDAKFGPARPGLGVAHYVLECGGPGPPLAGLHDARTDKLERILYDTRPTRSTKLRKLALPSQRSFEVALGSGSRARVQLMLPPSWREELRDAAFPVLVQVDGRPGSQQVSERFAVDWGTYMSSRNDVVYVKLDVAGARGLPRDALRGRLGGVEVADQLDVIRYLLETFKFLDETRVGVWGWGYGGYVTTMLLGSQQQVLKCGIAVSPITDWLYYNSAFTERVLGQPTANYKGYVESDATQRAHHVPPHALYLLHGMADLSAPYQHAFSLARALTEAGVIFRYQSYADEGHTLSGVIEHVYRSMEDFLRECLSLDPEDTKLPPPDR